jgi:hypothetical protein
MDSTKRFVTLVLAAGAIVLVAAIALGERMGDRVLVEATDSGSSAQSPLVTPLPESTATGPYGPDWKSTQPLAAAADPRFPDPRVPPKPLPTLPPTPKATATPKWTPNPNVPIWDQTPPGSSSPSAPPSPSASPGDDTIIASPQPTGTP